MVCAIHSRFLAGSMWLHMGTPVGVTSGCGEGEFGCCHIGDSARKSTDSLVLGRMRVASLPIQMSRARLPQGWVFRVWTGSLYDCAVSAMCSLTRECSVGTRLLREQAAGSRGVCDCS